MIRLDTEQNLFLAKTANYYDALSFTLHHWDDSQMVKAPVIGGKKNNEW